MKIIVTIILSDLVKNTIFVIPYKPKTLYFTAMLNSINFHKEISLYVIPARIVVPYSKICSILIVYKKGVWE